MKTSQITVITALCVIAAVIIGVIVAGRLILKSAEEETVPAADFEVLEEVSAKDLKDFRTVLVDGVWSVRIEQSDAFFVDLSYPSDQTANVRAWVSDDALTLEGGSWADAKSGRFSAVVQMPSLSMLRLMGTAEVAIHGFHQDRVDLEIDGAGRIEAADSSARHLNVSLRGLGEMDLRGLRATDARVDLNGAGEIRVRMDGGVLEGTLDGLGSIQYSGTVSDERIQVDGWGSVEAR